jgi:hypothetical protein
MRLITEINENIECIVEGENKSLYITGPFMQSEVKNNNGRIYPKSVMESAVSKYLENKVNNRTAYGELGHPNGPKINEDRISHLITELKWNGNDVIGKARILNTNMGNIARGIQEGGGQLGVSSRGLGTLKQISSGIMEVQNDFHIATAADIVTDPSAPGALVNGIMENVEYFFDESNGDFLARKSTEIKEQIKKMSIKEIEEKKFRIFESFIKSIR